MTQSESSVNPADAAITIAADRLALAAQTRVGCAPVRDLISDIDAAYAVQRVTVERAVASGRRVAGRKIGLTSAAVQKQLGVDSPDFGALFADEIFMTGAVVDLDQYLAPRVEAEIAFIMERDVDIDTPTGADVQRAIGLVVPAIEIVDSRIAGWDITLVDTVADNASGAATVLGQARPFGALDLDLRMAGMTLDRGGEVVSTGAGASCMGHPLAGVVWLAQELSRRGDYLRAGDVVMSGALGPMSSVDKPGTYEAQIEGVGTVRVSFDGTLRSASSQKAKE